MLSLFAGSARRDGEQIQGLLGLSVTPSTLRRSDQPWQPFCPGLAIRLELDPEAFNSGSMVIFSGVLARFLTLYCSVDRFIQTSVWRGEDQLIQWPPMHGGQALL
jgi:type VI secretion system protein ImpG